jgi:hypothetical protein
MQNMAEHKPFNDAVDKLLKKGDMGERSNVVLRALVLNNDKLAEKIILVAVWDFVHAGEEIQQGNIAMFFLYLGAGVVGTSIALISLASSAAITAWLPILFIILVVVVVLIEVFKDNKIQDWMERTLWGTYRDEYDKKDAHQSTEYEMGQFKIAVEADWS